MTTAFVAIVCLLLQATPKPAVLQGHVVRAGSSAPVAHARIVVAKVGGTQRDYRTASSDASGRFTVANLSPGTYRVYATREGYRPGEYGRRGVGATGVPIVLAEDQTSPDLEIVMTPTGAIAGRVTEGARPLRNAWVRALKARYSDGSRTLSIVEWAQTDDRGEYRLYGLSPGLYLVAAIPADRPRIDGDQLVVPAMPSNATRNLTATRSTLTLANLTAAAFDRRVFPPVYYPGTTDQAAALPVEVRGGETALGVDLSVAAMPTFHVRGRVAVVGADPLAEVIVGMYPADGATFLRIPNPPVVAGSFDFPSVPPGRYQLTAQTKIPQGPLLRDTMAVDVVDRDVDGLAITLRPGVAVVGTLSIDGRPPSAADPPTLVQLQSSVGGYGAVRVEPDGSFTIEGVTPREYRFRVIQGTRAAWIRSARFGEDDVTNAPVRVGGDLQGRQLDIVVGASTQKIDALVLDADRQPVPGVLVIAVPDRSRRTLSRGYRSATTGADGRARIDGLAPGEHVLFATETIEALDWQDPAVLERQEGRGTPVQLREGENKSVTLKITS